MNLQVILNEDVPNLGRTGDVVKVRPGFARNFLLPRQLAVPATTAAVNRITHEKAVAVAKGDKAKKEAREIAEKINALQIKIPHRIGEDGKLFGSVTTKDIEAAVKAQGVTIERKKMVMADAIRAAGSYEIPVKLMTDVTATMKVEVVAK